MVALCVTVAVFARFFNLEFIQVSETVKLKVLKVAVVLFSPVFVTVILRAVSAVSVTHSSLTVLYIT